MRGLSLHRTFVGLISPAIIGSSFAGCSKQAQPSANAPPAATPSSTTAPAGQGDLSINSTGPTGISGATDLEQLVATVGELIRLTREYNELAATVQTREDYIQKESQLRELDGQISPLVEDIMIAERKMTPAEQAEFDRQYYDAEAKPVVDEKRAHQERFQGFFR